MNVVNVGAHEVSLLRGVAAGIEIVHAEEFGQVLDGMAFAQGILKAWVSLPPNLVCECGGTDIIR